MTISGTLSSMSVPDVLQWLANGRHTGTLVVANAQVEKSIFFKDGKIISCASTDPRERLKHLLVSHGFITEQQLAEALKLKDQRRMLLGKALVEMGALGEADLEQMVRLKAEESIFEVFTWTQGRFEFLDDELPAYSMVPISLGVTKLILEGMQRMDEYSQLASRMPAPETVPVLIHEPSPELELDEQERAVLAAIDDDRSVEEISLHTHTSEYVVAKLVLFLADEGLVKLVKPRPLASDLYPAVKDADSLLSEAARSVESKEYGRALRYLRAAGDLEPHSSEIAGRIKDLEEEVRAAIEADGVAIDLVPRLTLAVEELTQLRLSPVEGFIVSRVNGRDSVRLIVKISPMPELDALVVVWQLLKAELIVLGEPGNERS